MPTSNNPDPNAALATKSYWDARYDTTSSSTILVTGEEDSLGKAESYDWLKDFSFVRGFLEKWLPPADTGMEMGMGEGMGMENGKGKGPRILHAGNGNSVGGFSSASPLFLFLLVGMLWFEWEELESWGSGRRTEQDARVRA